MLDKCCIRYKTIILDVCMNIPKINTSKRFQNEDVSMFFKIDEHVNVRLFWEKTDFDFPFICSI